MPIPPSIKTALETIRSRWPELENDCEAEPIFVCSAGWRSGSTLLQRLLMPNCFVWGEPYGHACPIPAMAETIGCFTGNWPEPHFFHRGESADALQTRFIANLYPPVQALQRAHQAWFRELFEESARRNGHSRWGLKEVRLSVDHARYLKWLFPKAKFLFLLRNPYDAHRSFAARKEQGWKWFYRWPDEPLTVRKFARHWRELATGFAAAHQEVDGHLVRFEDLAAGRFGPIEEYLGFKLSTEAAQANPGDGGPQPLAAIAPAELRIMQAELGTSAAELGYPEPDAPIPGTYTTDTSVDVNDRSRCVILVPVGSHILPRCEDGLRELERRGYTVRRVYGYAAIDQGRNQMATDALADGFEETMWIDADVAFHPDDIDKLRSHGKPIVCGIYPQKGKRALACHVMPGTEQFVFGQEGRLYEILYAATGFLYVQRQVYLDVQQQLPVPLANQAFKKPMIPFFQPMIRDHDAGNWYLAEDYAFCHRVRDAGYQIFADTSIRLWHIGNYPYSWEDAGVERKRYGSFHFNFT